MALGRSGNRWGGEASALAAWPGASLLLSPGLPCPQGSPDCRKQCEPDYYLNRDGRCTACVSCARGKGCVLPSRGNFLGGGHRGWGVAEKVGSIKICCLDSGLAPWCLGLPLWICELLSAMMFCIRFQRDLETRFLKGGTRIY